MRARPLLTLLATASAALVVAAGAEAQFSARASSAPSPQPVQRRVQEQKQQVGLLLRVIAAPDAPPSQAADAPLPDAPLPDPPLAEAPAPDAPGVTPSAGLAGIQERLRRATTEAAANGATISVAIFDRDTGELASNGNTQIVGTASVAKLFIADDLLLQEAQGKTKLSPEDRQALDVMLQSSDDGAAERFWSQDGGDAIITQVARRYGLTATTPPNDGRWWNTFSSAPDLIHYYDKLLSGAGGLPPERARIIVNDLAASTPNGVDGYPQRFGIPDGLYAEPVAVKQGWMCCIGPAWMHLSTGVIGADRRYIMVIQSLQPADDATARQTITQAVKTIFPGGRI